MFTTLTTWLRSSPHSHRPARRPRRHLSAVEQLESRDVPNATYANLAALPGGNLSQDWSNTGLISSDNNWANVPSITGYVATGAGFTGTNPATMTDPDTGTVTVKANQSDATQQNVGVAEFDGISNPTVAIQGANGYASYLLINLNTTGVGNVTVQYNLRDLDGSANNAIQAVALQYRVGTTGNFTTVSTVADATTANSASQVTPVFATLPADANNQAQVQVRIITANAGAVNEFVGVDDIVIHGNLAPTLAVDSGQLIYTEANPPIRITPTATVSDPDSADFSGGALAVDFVPPSGTAAAVISANDILSIRNQGTGTGQIGVSGTDVTYNPGSGAVTIGSFVGGTYDSVANSFTPLVITFNSNATPAAAQALIRNVMYSNTSSNPVPNDDPAYPERRVRTARFVLTDGDGGTSTPATRDISVTPVNNAPTLTVNGAIGYTEQDPPVLLAPAGTITDPDSPDFDTGTLTVQFASGATADDVLAIQPSVSTGGQVSVNGADVAYGGMVIGSFTGGIYDPIASTFTPLIITFNANSSPAAAQAVLRAISFQNLSDNPPAHPRSVQFVVTDGDTGTSNTQSVTLTITPVNDPPVVTLPGGGIIYTENDPRTVIDPNATVTDPDSANFSTGKLTVSFTANGSADDDLWIIDQTLTGGPISLSGTSTTTVTYNGTSIGTVTQYGLSGGPLVINLNANATPAAVQALIQAIGYLNTSENPSTLTRTVQFVLTDGDGGTSTPATATIQVVAVDDAPVIVGVDGTTVNYPAGDPAVNVAPGAAVSDVDSPDFNSGSLTATIASGGQAGDVLALRNQGTGTGQVGISGANVTYGGVVIGTVAGGTNGAPLVITFTSPLATPAVATAILADVTFRTPNGSGVAGNRTVEFTVNDGDGATSLAADVTVAVGTNGQAYDDFYNVDEDHTLNVTAPGVFANDGAGSTYIVGSLVQPNHGSATLNADGSFTYIPSANFAGTDTFTYQFTDSFSVVYTATVTIIVNPVNDPPTVAFASNPVVVNEDAGPQAFTGFAVIGPGGGADEANQHVTIQVDNDNHSLFLSQPAIDANGKLTFTTAPNANGSANVTVTLIDNGSTSYPGDNNTTITQFTIVVNPVNDAPTFQLAMAGVTVNEDAGPQSFSGFVASFQPGPPTATDEANQTPTYLLSILATNGGLTFTSAPTIDANGTLTFTTAPNANGSAILSVQVRDSGGTTNGGQDLSGIQVFTITVNPVNDPPTAGDDAAQVYWHSGPATIDVLANDSSAPDEGETLTIVGVSQGAHGAVAITAGGRAVTYLPANDFLGTDTFTYTISDGNGGTATATVTVSVVPKPTNAVDLIAFGSGPGGGSLVSLYNAATGAFVTSFTAFDPSFSGGVSVALGDVNGDGVPDIVVGAGAGGGPRVIVVDGSKLGLLVGERQIANPAALLANFFAYDPGFTGGVTVAVGDVNGDGCADVVVGTGAGGGPNVKVISGAGIGQVGPFGQIADSSVLASFFAYSPNFRGGVNVAVGDVNGDGYADVITGAGAGGGSHVKVFDARRLNLAGTPNEQTLMSFYAYEPSFRGGVNVAAGDLNGDGYADVMTGAGVGGGSHVNVFDGKTHANTASFYAFGPTFGGGVDVGYRARSQGTPLLVAGGGSGSAVTLFAAPDYVPVSEFDAFTPDFLGGVDVG